MNLTHLHYFRKMAQLEHYTKAAQALYISQPSLSTSISSMEDELQIKLFRKSGRNVKLTPEGRTFYHYVCKALDTLQEGIQHVKTGQHSQQPVKLAGTPSQLFHRIPQILQSFQNTYPEKFLFELESISDDAEIQEQLLDGRIQFGICSEMPKNSELTAIPFTAVEMTAVCNHAHPLGNRSFVTLEELHHFPLIIHENQQNWLPLTKTAHHPIDTFSDPIALSTKLFQQPNLIALAEHSAMLDSCGHLVRLPVPELTKFPLWLFLCYHKQQPLSKPMEAFLAFLKTHEKAS